MASYLIAGGSRGIGLETVRRLTAAGHDLVVFSRTRGELGDDVRHVACDLSTDELPADELPEQIDGLVYCPGTINLRSFRLLKPDDYLADFNVNVLGAVRLLKAALPALQRSAHPPASVVLFSTVAVGQGMPMHASIATAKGALEGLTRSLAAELAPKVRVNAIAPALTETPLAQRFFATPEKAAAKAERYALRRTGKPQDIASAVTFLLGPESDWMTGQVLGIDGGMSTLRA